MLGKRNNGQSDVTLETLRNPAVVEDEWGYSNCIVICTYNVYSQHSQSFILTPKPTLTLLKFAVLILCSKGFAVYI